MMIIKKGVHTNLCQFAYGTENFDYVIKFFSFNRKFLELLLPKWIRIKFNSTINCTDNVYYQRHQDRGDVSLVFYVFSIAKLQLYRIERTNEPTLKIRRSLRLFFFFCVLFHLLLIYFKTISLTRSISLIFFFIR